jgi:hypothetical protein
MVSPIPPLMIGAPTPFPLSIQISSPVVGGAAVFAMIMDRFVQSRFRLLDSMLTLASVVRVHERSRHK